MFSDPAASSLPSAPADGHRGALPAPPTAIGSESTTEDSGGAMPPLSVARVVRVPLERPEAPVGVAVPYVRPRRDRETGAEIAATDADRAWAELLALGSEAAGFANGMVAGWWAEAHGWQPRPGVVRVVRGAEAEADDAGPALAALEAASAALRALGTERGVKASERVDTLRKSVARERSADGQTTFKDFAGVLSGDVRASVASEAQAAWRKSATRILRRHQRLVAFAVDRSLSIRGAGSWGNGGVRITRDGEGVTITLRLFGVAHGGAHTFRVWPAALRKDRYLASLLDKLASGQWRCSKVALKIDPRRRKLYAMCAYERPVPRATGRGVGATVGPLEADGSLLLRASDGRVRDFSREAHEVRSKKAHYDGIVKRFRRSVGRGPRWRQVYRRNLPPTYGAWATGRLHQLSAAMIAWCVAERVGRLTLLPLGDGDWPAQQLEEMLRYKGEDAGITVVTAASLEEEPAQRAALAPVRKAQRQAGRARKAARVLAEALDLPAPSAGRHSRRRSG